jgi:hypothetical protein
MADGGMPMADERMPMRAPMKAPMGGMPARGMPMRPRGRGAMPPAMSPAMMARKKGGEVESPKMHKAEMKEMGKIEKELKHHESMKASKAHKGLKTGGVANAQGGYKKGGMPKYATGGIIQKYATGGVVNGQGGFKDGGFCAMKTGGEAGFKANKKSCSW